MKSIPKKVLIVIVTCLVVTASIVIYALYPYFGQKVQERPVSKELLRPEKVNSFLMVPGDYTLTEKERTRLLTQKSVDLVIIKETVPDNSFVQQLQEKGYLVGILDFSGDISSLSARTAIFTQSQNQHDRCYSDIFCLTYSHAKEVLIFTIGGTNFTYTIQTCDQFITCYDKQFSLQIPYQNVLFIKTDGSIYDLFSQVFPILSLSVADSYTVEFQWLFDTKLIPLIQDAYSVEVTDPTTQYSYIKTGKKEAPNQGDYFIPLVKPKSNNFTLTLRVWYSLNNEKIPNPLKIEKEFTKVFQDIDLSSVDDTHKLEETTWIPSWGMTRALTSLQKNPTKWKTLSPVWFFLKEDGTLTYENTLNNSTLLSIAKKNNIEIIPTITQFDADILSKTLNEHLDKHISIILGLVDKYNYAGIDIDYESTYEKDKEVFQDFIVRLSEEIHKRGKKLTFSAVSKWSDNSIFSYLPQTKKAHDWKFMSTYVDEIRIMAYDYTSRKSFVPGPMSPILWEESLIRYALTQIPPEKIVLALPLYGHAWENVPQSDPAGINNDQIIKGSGDTTDSLQHEDINNIRKRTSAQYTERTDEWNQEIMAQFTLDGKKKTLYYLNADMINQRKKLAQKYKIKGIAYWRIGGEVL